MKNKLAEQLSESNVIPSSHNSRCQVSMGFGMIRMTTNKSGVGLYCHCQVRLHFQDVEKQDRSRSTYVTCHCGSTPPPYSGESSMTLLGPLTPQSYKIVPGGGGGGSFPKPNRNQRLNHGVYLITTGYPTVQMPRQARASTASMNGSQNDPNFSETIRMVSVFQAGGLDYADYSQPSRPVTSSTKAIFCVVPQIGEGITSFLEFVVEPV
jgi:hypothetical protein